MHAVHHALAIDHAGAAEHGGRQQQVPVVLRDAGDAAQSVVKKICV